MIDKINPPSSDQVTFWFHPESDSYWIAHNGAEAELSDGLSTEISEEQFINGIIEQIDQDSSHKLPKGVTAIIKGAYQFPAGGLHGSIYYDQNGRFPDGHQVKLSTIVKKEPGGIYHTKNSTYLVQMIQPVANSEKEDNNG